MSDPRTQLVADGYDAVGETFAIWRERIADDPRREWEDELVSLEAWTGDWLGSPTSLSGFPPEIDSRLVREAGVTIERDEVVELHEPEAPVRFRWVLACA